MTRFQRRRYRNQKDIHREQIGVIQPAEFSLDNFERDVRWQQKERKNDQADINYFQRIFTYNRSDKKLSVQCQRVQGATFLIFLFCAVFTVSGQEPLTAWQDGQARHYSVVNNAALLPELSCGFVESKPAFETHPFGRIGSLSLLNDISTQHSLSGCGACIEIKCSASAIESELCSLSVSESIIFTVYDICSMQTQQVQCSEDEVVIPAYMFQDLAPIELGSLDIQYRQVECQPNTNITLIIDEYYREFAPYLSLKFRDVAGDGSISKVELRQTPSDDDEQRLLNANDWFIMNRFGQSGFDFNGVPDSPLDLRLTGAGGQIAILKGIITEQTGKGEYDTQMQFQTGLFLTRIPVVTDFPTASPSLLGRCSCEDKIPQGAGDFNCEEELRYGRCDAQFLVSGDWCAKTCGRCSCPAETLVLPGEENTPPPTDEIATTILTQSQQKNQRTLVDAPILAVEFPDGNAEATICPISLGGILQNSPDLKMFFEAVSVTRIAEQLQDPYLTLTVFAPNNFAFQSFVERVGIDWDTLKNQYPGLLQRIVLYQIIPGMWNVRRLNAAGYDTSNPLDIITLLPHSSVSIAAKSGTSLSLRGPVNSASSLWVDLSICDSMLHYVDAVVIPFTNYTLTKLDAFAPVTVVPTNMNGTVVLDNGIQNLDLNFIENLTVVTAPRGIGVTNITVNEFDPYTMNEVIKPDLSDVSPYFVSTYPESTQTVDSNTSFVEIPVIEPIYSYNTDPSILLSDYQDTSSYENPGFDGLTQICPSIMQIISRNPSLGVFEQFVKAAGYDQILNDVTRKFTVFAPVDDAFLKLLQQEDTTLEDVLQRQQELRIIIGYHVVSNLYTLDELRILANSPALSNKLSTFTQFQSRTLQLELEQSQTGEMIISGIGSNATVDREIRSCESVVFTINTVLLPYNITATRTPSPSPNRPQMDLPTLNYNLYTSNSSLQPSDTIVCVPSGSVGGQTAQPEEAPIVRMPPEQQLSAPSGIVAEGSPPQCTSLQRFFGVRGVGEADLRYFQILVDVSRLEQALYFPESRINLFVPTNDGFDVGLRIINSTFDSVLLDPQAMDHLVRYHVVNGESRLEDLAESPGGQMINIPTAFENYNIQIQPDDFANDGQLRGVTSHLTRARVVDRVELCQGIVYVIDTVLLPQGFKINP